MKNVEAERNLEKFPGAPLHQRMKKDLRSCSYKMELFKCCDTTLINEQGSSPQCRRILDFDYCHNVIIIKYAGEHSCFVGPNVKPMDIQLVR